MNGYKGKTSSEAQLTVLTVLGRRCGVPSLVLAAGSLVYCLLSLGLFFVGGFRFLPRVMAWNLFLALLPLAFAFAAQFSARKRRKGWFVLTGMLWLLFFPNAPYMVTDVIHLHLFEYYGSGVFLQDFTAWAFLLYVAVGILLGTTAGMLSLDMIREEFRRRKGRSFANITVVAASAISGYAIYVGRFLRFNSWDILRPWLLLRRLIQCFDRYAAAFSCLAAVYVLLVYGLFYAVYAAGDPAGRGKDDK